MKVVCGWCKKSLGEKEPLEDKAVSHGICPKCAKAFEGENKKGPVKRNAGTAWKLSVGTAMKPRVINRLVGGVLFQLVQKEATSWRLLQRKIKSGELFSVGTFPTMQDATDEADEGVEDYILQTERNPGAAWHGMKELEADQQDHHVKKRTHKDFFHGKSIAHLESGLAARAMKMNPGRRTKKYRHGVSAYGIAVQHGFSFIRGEGHSGKGIWYNRFTKTASGDGPALYVGYDEKRKRWLVYGDEPLHRGIPGVGQTPIDNPLAVFTVGNPKRRPLKYRTLQKIGDVEERHRVKLAYDQLRKPSRVAGRRGMPSTRTARKILKRHGFKEPEGNPPKRLNVGIAGVVYNRALEIRAEKTEYQPGLYKHPFDRTSRVEVLALDNGDLLLHSTVGVRLWGSAT